MLYLVETALSRLVVIMSFVIVVMLMARLSYIFVISAQYCALTFVIFRMLLSPLGRLICEVKSMIREVFSVQTFDAFLLFLSSLWHFLIYLLDTTRK